MKKLFIFALMLMAFGTIVQPAVARSGCCSYHQGVRADGCGCNDDSPLSDKCAPYYVCSAGQTEVAAPIIPTNTPVPYTPRPIVPTNTPYPTRVSPTTIPYKETAKDKKKLFKVVSVIDGDSMVVNIRGKQETIQLLGIDAPAPTQCFGKAANDKLKGMVQGKYVKVVRDPSSEDRDLFGNLLRHVYLTDKQHTLVNGELIKQGYAFSTQDEKKFNKYELSAKTHNKGWWAVCGPKIITPTKPVVQIPTNTPVLKQQAPAVNSGSTYGGGDKDCKDFATHADAQAYFTSKGGSATNNVDRLDADHDGSACDALP